MASREDKADRMLLAVDALNENLGGSRKDQIEEFWAALPPYLNEFIDGTISTTVNLETGEITIQYVPKK